MLKMWLNSAGSLRAFCVFARFELGDASNFQKAKLKQISVT